MVRIVNRTETVSVCAALWRQRWVSAAFDIFNEIYRKKAFFSFEKRDFTTFSPLEKLSDARGGNFSPALPGVEPT